MSTKKEIIRSIAQEFNLKLIECDLVMFQEQEEQEEQDKIKVARDIIHGARTSLAQAILRNQKKVSNKKGNTYLEKDKALKDCIDAMTRTMHRLYDINETI